MNGYFDSTFFKDFHRGLVHIVKHLLSKAESSEAIFLSPKRGNSLDLFLEVAEENGLCFSVTENYDKEVWKRHEGFLNGEDRDSWPSYEKGHSYPLLIRITLWTFFQSTFCLGPPFIVGWLFLKINYKSIPPTKEISSTDTNRLHGYILFCWGHIFSRHCYSHPRRLKWMWSLCGDSCKVKILISVTKVPEIIKTFFYPTWS